MFSSSDSERAKATSRCRTKYTTTARLTSEALARTNTKSAVWIAVGSGSTGELRVSSSRAETNSSATQAAAHGSADRDPQKTSAASGMENAHRTAAPPCANP